MAGSVCLGEELALVSTCEQASASFLLRNFFWPTGTLEILTLPVQHYENLCIGFFPQKLICMRESKFDFYIDLMSIW